MTEEERCLKLIDGTINYHKRQGNALVVATLKNLRSRFLSGARTTRSQGQQAQHCADSNANSASPNT